MQHRIPYAQIERNSICIHPSEQLDALGSCRGGVLQRLEGDGMHGRAVHARTRRARRDRALE
jgi:hypothetical protein